MNDINLTLGNVLEIIKETETRKLTLSERAALFAATSVIVRNVREHIKTQENIDQGYAAEKINNVLWHVGAVLGFDITNNHPADQHRVWARGELDSLKSVLTNSA
jgi:hypothetical protein